MRGCAHMHDNSGLRTLRTLDARPRALARSVGALRAASHVAWLSVWCAYARARVTSTLRPGVASVSIHFPWLCADLDDGVL